MGIAIMVVCSERSSLQCAEHSHKGQFDKASRKLSNATIDYVLMARNVKFAGWAMQGFEVDYIVHVATCIGHSPESGRAGVTFALRTMGMSVVSGYTTTVGAALFLLPCEMGVFTQFGMLLSPVHACSRCSNVDLCAPQSQCNMVISL